jgi:hypothetical protein
MAHFKVDNCFSYNLIRVNLHQVLKKANWVINQRNKYRPKNINVVIFFSPTLFNFFTASNGGFVSGSQRNLLEADVHTTGKNHRFIGTTLSISMKHKHSL